MTRPPPVSTYDDDFYAWTQDQAAALRVLPADGLGRSIDIAHLAEEIADLRKSDLREAVSYLERLFENLIKITSSPASRDVQHWRIEVRLFARSAKRGFSPGMGQLIDVVEIWRQARANVTSDSVDLGLCVSAPVACPFVLKDLLVETLDVVAAQAKLEAALRSERGDP